MFLCERSLETIIFYFVLVEFLDFLGGFDGDKIFVSFVGMR